MKKNKSKKAFSLIELSVVLVLIGLLIGGILIARSMISAARFHGVIKQFSQYDTMIETFVQKYGTVPGDSNSFDPPGNNNGSLNAVYDNDEIINFWKHLSLADMIKSEDNANYIAIDYTSPTKAMCPTLDISKGTYRGCLYPSFGYGANAPYAGNFFFTGPWLNGGSIDQDVALPKDIKQLDLKLDDGIPNSGRFIANSYSVFNTAPIPCSSGATYSTSDEYYSCSFFYSTQAFQLRAN